MPDFSKYKLNVKPSPPDPRDFKASAIYKKITLPRKLDLRDQMFAVRDQGEQGSCVAMTGAAMKEWQEVNDVGLDNYMSPQFIYNNRENPDEEGMYLRDLMRILKELGDCLEPTYPYGADYVIPEKAFDEALVYTIKNYAVVNTQNDLKTALYQNGPCAIAVPVYNFSTRMWKPEPGEEELGGHCMTVCGFDDDEKCYLVRNSWSTAWGEDGYCKFPYEDWGLQWEIRTSIDAESPNPKPPVPEPSWWSKNWWWVSLLTVLVVGLAIIFKFNL